MMEGSLSKWTNVMKGWQYRWFVLDENAGLLSYYTSLLKSCMKEFVSTIENKNTDTNTNKSKTVAWQMVAQRFNELNGRERDITEIKQQWRTMKLDAKKNMSTLKISMKCTGGGPKPPSPSAETMEILSMIPQEFEKDFNVYDSDGIATKKGELESQESQEFVLTPVALENIEDVEESKEKMTRGVRRGCVRLRAAIIGIDDEDDSTFTITVDHKTFHFQARDGSERERWVRALEDTILRHGRRERWSRSVPAPRHRHGDLERRISEADAYLQIIIDLVSKMNTRVTELADPLEKSKGQIILDHSNAMLDNIKHSIVLLQIAKNTVNPVNGVYQGPTNVSQTHIKQGADISPNVEMGAECRELSTPTHSIQPLEDIDAPRQAMSLLVPDTSYSSSEGEDDFYDADDEPADTQPPGPSASRNCTAEGAPEQDSGQPAVDLPRTRDGEIDYDALYEDESDSDLGSMENHGSVVTHLLSQVKIGMDLTKVVLPTFILERRSLLEMYADSFAHPDQFVKIVDMATPRERMVQVVRWYLSSYHAGRKSQVAKKPYNPILGEVFRCYWDLDGAEGSTNAEKQEVGDGPVPWCSPDQLSFVAEQVSHHPPISAFYAEHVNKKIQFEAWLWTKSKFLGLSIGVHNIGKGIVTLLDTGEEYTLTFPNGYGRSILTVPWIELGGSVCIECQQTGHKANIEFLTKPFYGGKKHRVTCEVFAGLDKKPYYTAQGEWNSRMDGRWTDTGRTEAVFEVSNMKARRKRVAPIVRQSGHESRRVWRHVTCALRAADCDAATNAKRDVEQHQRDAVKIRHANGDKWITQLFSPKGEDAWEYNSPLRKRLESKNNTTPQHKSTENADNTR